MNKVTPLEEFSITLKPHNVPVVITVKQDDELTYVVVKQDNKVIDAYTINHNDES